MECAANYIKRSNRISMEEHLTTKEIEHLLRHDIDNWIRWGRKRDWMPTGFKCPTGFMFKSNDVHEPSYKPLPCNEISAADFERIIIRLPQRNREAFVLHQLDKAHILGFIVIVRGRDEKARILGVQKSMYHRLLNQAYNMIYRDWKNIYI
jgi:hypothetical protein